MGIRRPAMMFGVAALVGLTGCNVTGPCQRMFAWSNRDLRTEARLYDVHDPYPDEAAGPGTATRPLAFEEPRSDTRRDFDLRLLLSMVGSPDGPAFAGRYGNGPYISPISPVTGVPVRGTTPTPAAPVATQPAVLVPAY